MFFEGDRISILFIVFCRYLASYCFLFIFFDCCCSMFWQRFNIFLSLSTHIRLNDGHHNIICPVFFFFFEWNLFIVFCCCSKFTNLFAYDSIQFLFYFDFNQFLHLTYYTLLLDLYIYFKSCLLKLITASFDAQRKKSQNVRFLMWPYLTPLLLKIFFQNFTLWIQ